MRIAFVDYIGWDYRVDSVYQRPLGGSQSALCYLSQAIARQGNEVFLLNQTSLPGMAEGVFCVPLESASAPFLQSLDALIVLNGAGRGRSFRTKLNPQALLVLWTQHAADQPDVQILSDRAEQESYDAIAFVSDWQRGQFCQKFDIAPDKTFILRNAIAPMFQNLFSQAEAIYLHKQQPPTLAYTSTPFRGLDVLLQIFPEIRDRVPGTRLKVFSSMKVYQVSESRDREDFGQLYQQCLDTEGVEHVGSIPQPQLAEELRHVNVLAYPNTFAETSCIAVMEALASGCWVVSSELGALPETTAGFGRLVPMTEDGDAYVDRFIAEVVDVLTLDSSEAERHLRSQVAYFNQTCTWDAKAGEWSDWLTALLDSKGGIAFAPYSAAYRGYHMLLRERFEEAADLFEEAIAAEPTVLHYYWYLGLALVLDGREEDAQALWLSVMVEADSDQSEAWAAALAKVLLYEARRRQELGNEQIAWVLRRHIREIDPGNLENELQVIHLSLDLELLENLDEVLVGLVESLHSQELAETEWELLLNVFEKLIVADLLNEALNEAIARLAFQSENFAKALLQRTGKIFAKGIYSHAVLARFATFDLHLQPENLPSLARAISFYQNISKYKESIQLVDRLLELSPTPFDRIAGLYMKIKAFLQSGGNFHRAKQYHEELMALLEEVIASEEPIHENHLLSSFATVSFASYLGDTPEAMHRFRYHFASFWQSQIVTYAKHHGHHIVVLPPSNRTNPEKPLNIGYLSACFGRHSVGFLSRWLFQYADRDRYRPYAYSLAFKADEIQQFFEEHSTFRDLSETRSIQEIAKAISDDEIDILVDLDSLTSTKACAVMALKPAPVQATWLGFDATELPAIDYFIVDPYVLPESAQTYYHEKLWRLPETYIAVDGFEVGVPDIRRSDLDIPEDAVVYFSSQTGQKRHPTHAKLQMDILSAVPNSYFLIKGSGTDRKALEAFFGELADAAGINRERIKYLPHVSSEKIHRANIAIADVVLDTFPYNGATTTMETLWMGIPIVTQVGEQFAARNSYTMLMNAGVIEGIATTEAEYVEWGIRMGKDANLRSRIAETLRNSRKISPLWNGKKFTRTMEDAFRSMWHIFVKGA